MFQEIPGDDSACGSSYRSGGSDTGYVESADAGKGSVAVLVLAGDRNVLRGIILVSKKYKNFQERDFMFLSDIGVFKNCFRKLLLWKKRAANRILADTP